MFVKMTEIKSISGSVLYCLQRDGLRGYDFSGKDLQMADLRGMDLEGCAFRGSDLTGARLDGSVLRCCDFTGCYMIGCTFDGADLTGSTGLELVRSNRSINTNVNEMSHFYSASWKGCNFTGIDLSWVDPKFLNGGWTSFFDGCKGIKVSRQKSAQVFL